MIPYAIFMLALTGVCALAACSFWKDRHVLFWRVFVWFMIFAALASLGSAGMLLAGFPHG